MVFGFICGLVLVGDVIEDWMYEFGVKLVFYFFLVMVLLLVVVLVNWS